MVVEFEFDYEVEEPEGYLDKKASVGAMVTSDVHGREDVEIIYILDSKTNEPVELDKFWTEKLKEQAIEEDDAVRVQEFMYGMNKMF